VVENKGEEDGKGRRTRCHGEGATYKDDAVRERGSAWRFLPSHVSPPPPPPKITQEETERAKP